ncbi:HET-domain-containing protein [Lentithecium fluviatile CBS 122367]|uniref:HET-domain-containing protein n=1 Tax=Lentithecium fluviatile CBS 122367 TaxID=1168545 RepID=A0A6G1JD60_9PLEO|nr:HET-domain-containing protein [Lentithecium fluviatile CBS 122367]
MAEEQPEEIDYMSEDSGSEDQASLSDHLYRAMSKSEFDKSQRQFVPDGALDGFLTRDRIIHALDIDKKENADKKYKYLVNFCKGPAKRVFATTVLCIRPPQGDFGDRLRHAMQLFKSQKFDDSKLPVEDPREQVFALMLRKGSNKPFWTPREIDDFCDDFQWRFRAPVFSTNSKTNLNQYNLHGSTIIPFIKKHADRGEGKFGKVTKYEIHPNHIQGDVRPGVKCPTVLAVKEIRPGDAETRKQVATHWESEIKALERMNDLDEEHIVRFVAAFRRCHHDAHGGKEHFLIFEWADGGNLWNFWEANPQPVLNGSLVKDATDQLSGLATALWRAHHLGGDASYRHGDLKPANILRFGDEREEANDAGALRIGTLKIGDWGEAKGHNLSTELRLNRTTARYGTQRYEAPEVTVGVTQRYLNQSTKRRSRLYDIWAMGCITLEFIIWLMYGYEGLEQFNGEFGQSEPFYQVDKRDKKDVATVHAAVIRWMDHLANEPACATGSALGRLLELVRDRLLVVKLNPRTATYHTIPTTPFRQPTELHTSSFTMDPAVQETNPDVPSIKVSPAEPSPSSSPEPERIPVTPKPQPKGRKEEGGDDYWFTDAPRSAPPKNLTHASGNGGAEGADNSSPSVGMSQPTGNGEVTSEGLTAPEAKRLDEQWNFEVDNQFAASIISAYKASAGSRVPDACPTSQLCDRCRSMREELWRPGFNVIYDTAGLAARAEARVCHLCRLLWRTCQKFGVAAYPTAKFDRELSLLKLNGGSFPALSVFRSSDLQTRAADGIQIGFSELAEAGSPAHIKVLSQWLDECNKDETHSSCWSLKSGRYANSEALTRMPTRLIDVGSIGEKRVRLHQTAAGDSGNWIALSHQWGPPPYFSTNRQNLEAHMVGMEFKLLPPTFRDAVTLTRALGLKYLWIDSICIIQGKDGDFNEESKRMEDVYSGAYCVVAASRALCHNAGFLQSRRPRDFVALCQGNEAPFYISEMIDDFQSHVLNGALNSRGWVMQEHALARRTIFFTEHQTYWECGGGVRCETMTKLNNNLAASLGDPDFPSILNEAEQGERILRYQKLYHDYSRLGLSNDYDRPTAIAGLQRRLLRALDAKGGFGMFDEGAARGLLCRSLLWRRGSDMPKQSLKRIKFPADRVISAVPSWSWMAYTGGIDYLELDFGGYVWQAVEPPWSRAENAFPRTEDRGISISLNAEAQECTDYVEMAAGNDRLVVLDMIPGSDQPKEAVCVVLGIEKGKRPLEEKKHCVIFIKQTKERERDGSRIYERIGVGYFPGKCIVGPKFKVAIH